MTLLRVTLCTGHSETMSPEKALEIGKGVPHEALSRRELAEAVRRALYAHKE